MMKSDRRTASILGLLLISGTVFGILNTVPALEFPNYLAKLSTIRTQVLIAVFFQAAMAIAYACIAILFFQIIKKYSEGLAIAYLAFRLIGAAFLFAGIASLSLLLFLSENYASAGFPDSSYYQTLGELLRTCRDLLNHVGMILPWMIGGLILVFCMFKMKLVPQWLSVWGIAGSSLTLLSTLMLMVNFIKMATPVYFIMNMPEAFFELTLAFYLIGKGFNPIVLIAKEKAGL